MKIKIILILFVTSLVTSCASKKKIIYLQGLDQSSNTTIANYEPKIQPDDLLYINISSESMEASAPFNLRGNSGQMVGGNAIQFSSYLVDNQGNIQIPVIGSFKAAGLTKTELHDLLKIKLTEYLKDPIILVRVVNFKASIMGEVKGPGTFVVNSDRITVLELIAQAGDLTPAANRENVLIVREESGVKSYYRINLTDPDILNSPIYYLKQNDLVIVEPRFTKPDSSAIGANLPLTISIVSLLITVSVLLTR